MTFWQERVKPNFMGDHDEDFCQVEHFIPVAGAADDFEALIEDGFFLLTKYVTACLTYQSQALMNYSDDIKDIFDPVIEDIEKLVDQQMSAVRGKGLSAKVNNNPQPLVYLANTSNRQSSWSAALADQNISSKDWTR